ncbi:hypothetical protein HDU76_005938 [Blyttiomyces sp. JEL0837]|nr:hypothetical protein HDU76_005938 [Blyttiomyces sp. JEL0837]
MYFAPFLLHVQTSPGTSPTEFLTPFFIYFELGLCVIIYVFLRELWRRWIFKLETHLSKNGIIPSNKLSLTELAKVQQDLVKTVITKLEGVTSTPGVTEEVDDVLKHIQKGSNPSVAVATLTCDNDDHTIEIPEYHSIRSHQPLQNLKSQPQRKYSSQFTLQGLWQAVAQDSRSMYSFHVGFPTHFTDMAILTSLEVASVVTGVILVPTLRMRLHTGARTRWAGIST